MLLFFIDLINIKNLIILFHLFYSFSFFNFILRSRATSIWYHNITSVRDQVIIFVLYQDPSTKYQHSSLDDTGSLKVEGEERERRDKGGGYSFRK